MVPLSSDEKNACEQAVQIKDKGQLGSIDIDIKNNETPRARMGLQMQVKEPVSQPP